MSIMQQLRGAVRRFRNAFESSHLYPGARIAEQIRAGQKDYEIRLRDLREREAAAGHGFEPEHDQYQPQLAAEVAMEDPRNYPDYKPARPVAEIVADYNAGRITRAEMDRQEEERLAEVGADEYWAEAIDAPAVEWSDADANAIEREREAAAAAEARGAEPEFTDLSEGQRLEYLADRAAEIAVGEPAAEFTVPRMEADGVPASDQREVLRTATFWKDNDATAEALAAEDRAYEDAQVAEHRREGPHVLGVDDHQEHMADWQSDATGWSRMMEDEHGDLQGCAAIGCPVGAPTAAQVKEIDAAQQALSAAQTAHGLRSPEAIAAGYALNAVVDASSLEELRRAAQLANERQAKDREVAAQAGGQQAASEPGAADDGRGLDADEWERWLDPREPQIDPGGTMADGSTVAEAQAAGQQQDGFMGAPVPAADAIEVTRPDGGRFVTRHADLDRARLLYREADGWSCRPVAGQHDAQPEGDGGGFMGAPVPEDASAEAEEPGGLPRGVTPVVNDRGAEIHVVDPARLGDFLTDVNAGAYGWPEADREAGQ